MFINYIIYFNYIATWYHQTQVGINLTGVTDTNYLELLNMRFNNDRTNASVFSISNIKDDIILNYNYKQNDVHATAIIKIYQ